MRPFDLVAADIDGTLLTQDGHLTRRTIQVISRLRDKGITFALATSRRYTGTAPVAEALAHTGPLILYDGALTLSYPAGAIDEIDALDADLARDAARTMHSLDLRVIAQFGDETGERLRVGPPAGQLGHDQVYLTRFAQQTTVVPLHDLIPAFDPVLRLLSFGALDHLTSAADKISSLPCALQVLPYGNYEAAELTVFSTTASKGNALLRLARRLGIPRERIFAVGDGLNDVSMLRAAGMSVAMGNAAPEIRAVAKAVAGTSDEDGAARAIERYCLS